MPDLPAAVEPPPRGSVTCLNRHKQYRHVVEPCDGHGAHFVYTCPMRFGGDVCGDVTTAPPRDGNCDQDKHGSP